MLKRGHSLPPNNKRALADQGKDWVENKDTEKHAVLSVAVVTWWA